MKLSVVASIVEFRRLQNCKITGISAAVPPQSDLLDCCSDHSNSNSKP